LEAIQHNFSGGFVSMKKEKSWKKILVQQSKWEQKSGKFSCCCWVW